jgi:hypothetical protein
LNIRGKKSVFAKDQVDLKRFKFFPGPKGLKTRFLPMTLTNDLIILESEATQGCDLWIDPDLAFTFFLSASLVEALRAAKTEGKLRLKSCLIQHSH